MNLTKLKFAAGMIASVGAGTVVGNAIKATSPGNPNLKMKITVAVGTFVLTSIAGSLAAKHTENTIDDIIDGVEEAKEELKKKV